MSREREKRVFYPCFEWHQYDVSSMRIRHKFHYFLRTIKSLMRFHNLFTSFTSRNPYIWIHGDWNRNPSVFPIVMPFSLTLVVSDASQVMPSILFGGCTFVHTQPFYCRNYLSLLNILYHTWDRATRSSFCICISTNIFVIHLVWDAQSFTVSNTVRWCVFRTLCLASKC